jgi:hypothetical protein
MLHIDVAGRLFWGIFHDYLFLVRRLLVVPGYHLMLLNCKWRLSKRGNHGGWLGPLSTEITLEVLEKGMKLLFLRPSLLRSNGWTSFHDPLYHSRG